MLYWSFRINKHFQNSLDQKVTRDTFSTIIRRPGVEKYLSMPGGFRYRKPVEIRRSGSKAIKSYNGRAPRLQISVGNADRMIFTNSVLRQMDVLERDRSI